MYLSQTQVCARLLIVGTQTSQLKLSSMPMKYKM